MSKLTYKASGVDVQAGEALVKDYSSLAAQTDQSQVLSGLGGYAGFYALPDGYRQPVLVSCTDGVGTKLRLLIDHDCPEVAGMDAAAMCLNDMATSGAKALFMLDYLACGKLAPGFAKRVVSGFADYCRQSRCALLGGETAEMPGFYPPGDMDIAGFAVGVVERDKIIDGSTCEAGDLVVGLAADGLHSNGFSLVRLLVDKKILNMNKSYPGLPGTLLEAVLRPTRLYVPLMDALIQKVAVKAMAHITGGGLPGNLARTVPKKLDVQLDVKSWPRTPLYQVLAETGVAESELFATFNMGIGFAVVVEPRQADQVIDLCRELECEAWVIGRLIPGSGKVKIDV